MRTGAQPAPTASSGRCSSTIICGKTALRTDVVWAFTPGETGRVTVPSGAPCRIYSLLAESCHPI
jgi:hypothetical protein